MPDTMPNTNPNPSAAPIRTVTGANMRPATASPQPQAHEQQVAATVAAMPVDRGVTPKHDPSEARASEPKPHDPIAGRIALLSKREAALTAKQRSWQAEVARREAALKNRQDEVEALRSEVESFRRERESAKHDPLAWLKLGGFDYDSATQAALNDGNLPPEKLVERETQDLRSEIQKLREEQAKREEQERKQREENEQAAREQAQRNQAEAMSNFVRQAVEHVKANAEKYKLVALFGAEREVPQMIDAYFRQTAAADVEAARREGRRPVGRILSFDEAAQYVEDFYREKITKSQEALGVAPAQQSMTSEVVPPPSAGIQPSTPGQRPTVTNAAVSVPSPNSGVVLSEAERYKRALEKLRAAPVHDTRA